jgi:hypothetical protein
LQQLLLQLLPAFSCLLFSHEATGFVGFLSLTRPLCPHRHKPFFVPIHRFFMLAGRI